LTAAPIEFPIGGIDDGVIRLRLRSDADTAAIVEACQDPEIPRWTRVPREYDEAKAHEWFAQAERQRQGGEGLFLLIVDAADDGLLGSIGLHEINQEEGRAETGYWLAREARGRGVMTRAVRLLAGWVFAEMPIDRLAILVQPENGPSHRVAESAGFSFEGVLRSHTVIEGDRRDMASYSLLRGELRSVE
jgi:RimJ/RimL family protein N-acetyltransferase